MLSIAKIGDAGYYLNSVAKGIEDYYALGEAPGRWIGQSAPQLGLDGEVLPDQLGALLAGRHPTLQHDLLASANRTVPAFDLTFRAPKSVSLAFALGTDEMTASVMAAHDAAVDAAVGYLERTAAWSRKGHNGVEQVQGDGFVAAAFRHRTSRALDPHLHTHVLVPNLVHSDDGRWRTLDARHLYAQSLTAGYLYEAHLRAELTRRLGVAWTPVVNGIADLHGIPDEVLRAFSTRREQIEAHLAKLGETSARAAEIAALATRKAKEQGLDHDELRDTWERKAIEHGFDPRKLETLLDRTQQRAHDLPKPDELVRIEQQLLGPDGLTARASTFDRRDVLRALAAAHPTGASVALIEAHADMLLEHSDIVKILDHSADRLRSDNGRTVTTVELGARYTTKELLSLEERLVNDAITRTIPLDPVRRNVIDHVLATRLTLADEQRHLIETLATSRRGVDVVTAPAGAGKTYALAAARDAWIATGRSVIGAALAARAAAELQRSAGIDATTLHQLTADLTNLRAHHVVVIDEAGMAPTRLLAPVLDAASKVGAKVVLVGDPRQLPEIGAGGLLAGFSARLPTIELSENRRQRHTWEQLALKELRNGQVIKALEAYECHDRIITSTNAVDAKTRIIDDWASARAIGSDVVILASRNDDIADLNALARTRRAEIGALSGPMLTISTPRGQRDFQAGDEIVLLRNDRRAGLRNGTRATVERVIDRSNIAMQVIDHEGTRHSITRSYVEAGHVNHGYALTIHKAQGLTCDQALVYATDDLYRELGYVAMSRGRDMNRLYLAGTPTIEPETEQHTRVQQRTAWQALQSGLSTSRAQELALDARERGAHQAPKHLTVPELHAELRRLEAVVSLTPPDRTDDIRLAEQRVAAARSDVARASEYRDSLEGRKRPLMDRLRGPDEQLLHANKTVDGHQTRLFGLEYELRAACDGQRRRTDYLAAHPDAPAAVRRIKETIADRIDLAVANDMIETPEYLLELIGDYRTAPDKKRWLEAAAKVEGHRLEHGIDDRLVAFGELPPAWADALRRDQQVEAVVELAKPEHERVKERQRGISMGM